MWSKIKPLNLALTVFLQGLVFLYSQSTMAQERCSDVMSYQQRLYSADYIPYIQNRLGGHATRWYEMFSRYNESNRSIEELVMIDSIFANTQARGWLARQSNAFKFVRLESITKTLDQVLKRQTGLNQTRQWNELNLYERRALLLVTFKKWWWEVDSHHVVGFSRWTDVSYLLSRSLSEPLAPGRLDMRLHELLATPTRNSFLSSLIRNFRSEIRTLEAVKNQPEAQEVLKQTLAHRVDFLTRLRSASGMQGQRLRLLNMQILRAAVLRQMMVEGRPLKTEEIATVARQIDVSPQLAREMFWGQVGMGLIPNMNSFVNIGIDIAITSAIAFVIGHYWFDDLEDDGIYQGSFDEMFSNFESP